MNIMNKLGSNKIPSEVNKKVSPQKLIKFEGGSVTTDNSLDDHNLSSKKIVSSVGKIKIKKNGLSNKNSNSEMQYFDSENKSIVCDKCGLIKESVIKTLSSLKSYVDSINERVNIIYHKTTRNKKYENEQFFSNDFFQFYSDVDKLKCSSDVSNHLRNLMKSVKILSDKYDYILKKQNYYENVVTVFRSIKNSNKDDVKIFLFKYITKSNLKELSSPNSNDNNTKEVYEMQEILRKYNSSKECAEKVIKELKTSMLENNNKTEDKTVMINDLEINLDFQDHYKDNYIKNELIRLQKENISLRMELNFVYEQLKEDNKIFELKEGGFVRKNSKDFSNENKKKNQNGNNSSNSFVGSIASNNNNNNPQNNNNPALFIKLKNENTEEIYVNYKNFINRLRLSEFYL